MSNAAANKKVLGWVVVDRAEGGAHVGDSVYKTRHAAEGAALLANAAKRTATRFEARPILAD